MGIKGLQRGFLGKFLKGRQASLDSFMGKETRKFDQTKRMPVPPRFKKGLGESFIMMKSIHGEPCIMLFPEDAWVKFRNSLISSSSNSEIQSKRERKLADMTETVSLDKSGRITIKEEFMQHAKLEDEVLAVGLGNRVELWAPENWTAWNSETDDEDIDLFGGVGYSDGVGII